MKELIYFCFSIGFTAGVCLHENVAIRTNFTINDLEYILTDNKTMCKCCLELCQSLNAEMAEVNIPFLSQDVFKTFSSTSFWVILEGLSSTVDCTYAYSGLILHLGIEIKNSLPCLCKRVFIESTSTSRYGPPVSIRNQRNLNDSNITGSKIFNIDGRQFLVHNINLSYSKAVENCKTFKANIVSFTNPLQYILLEKQVTLKGQYWVGDILDGNVKCLVLQATKTASLFTTNCANNNLYSICSRVSNDSNVVLNPKFTNLISNMTINVHKTIKMDRKLTSAKDNRTSTKVIGVTVGVVVICIVGGLLFSGDIINACKRMFTRTG